MRKTRGGEIQPSRQGEIQRSLQVKYRGMQLRLALVSFFCSLALVTCILEVFTPLEEVLVTGFLWL